MMGNARGGEKEEKKVWFYIALYPAQSALHFPPLADLFIPTPFSASLGSIDDNIICANVITECINIRDNTMV